MRLSCKDYTLMLDLCDEIKNIYDKKFIYNNLIYESEWYKFYKVQYFEIKIKYENEIKEIKLDIKKAFNINKFNGMEFVLNNYPSKNENTFIMSSEEIKINYNSILNKMLLLYHYDKNTKYSGDKKYLIICNEITIYLNALKELNKNVCQ